MGIDSLTSIALSALDMPSTSTDIGIAVLSKQLDLSETMGDSMVRAMELSVNPNVGSNIDIYI